MFGKRIKEQESRVKIKVEGEEEYIKSIQRMKKEAEELHYILKLVNDALREKDVIVKDGEQDISKEKPEVVKRDGESEIREKFIGFAEGLIEKASALSTEEIKNNKELVSYAIRVGEFICGVNYCHPRKRNAIL